MNFLSSKIFGFWAPKKNMVNIYVFQFTSGAKRRKRTVFWGVLKMVFSFTGPGRPRRDPKIRPPQKTPPPWKCPVTDPKIGPGPYWQGGLIPWHVQEEKLTYHRFLALLPFLISAVPPVEEPPGVTPRPGGCRGRCRWAAGGASWRAAGRRWAARCGPGRRRPPTPTG